MPPSPALPPLPRVAAAAWAGPVLAGVGVQAVGGLAAGVLALRGGAGDGIRLFVSCAVAAGLMDGVLIPGWLWAGRASPTVLGRRMLVMVVTLPVAAGFAAAFLSMATPFLMMLGLDSAGLLSSFAVAGAVAGGGAVLADRADQRPGALRGRWTTHVVGGLSGVLTVALATVGTIYLSGPVQEGGGFVRWPWWVLPPLALALGGGLHLVLLARDAERAGVAPPRAGLLAVRGAMLAALGGAAVVLAGVAP